MNLWAITDDCDAYYAAPSLEAATAACTHEGDRVVPWAFDSLWHAEDAAQFLSRFDSEVMQ